MGKLAHAILIPKSSLLIYVKKSYFVLHLNVTMRVFNLVGWLSIVRAALIFTDTRWTDVVTGVPFAVTWSGNVGAVTLTLENGTASNPNVVHHIQSGLVSNSFIWTPGVFATPGDEFFLNLNDSTGAQTFSPHFVIAASQATTSTTSTTPIPTATTTSQITGTTGPSSSSAPPSSSSNGLSTGAKIGIAVGAALGGVLLAILVVLALLWKRRGRNTKRNTNFEMDGTARYDGFEILEKPSRGGSKKGVYKLALATDEGGGTGELEGEGRPSVRHELQ